MGWAANRNSCSNFRVEICAPSSKQIRPPGRRHTCAQSKRVIPSLLDEAFCTPATATSEILMGPDETLPGWVDLLLFGGGHTSQGCFCFKWLECPAPTLSPLQGWLSFPLPALLRALAPWKEAWLFALTMKSQARLRGRGVPPGGPTAFVPCPLPLSSVGQGEVAGTDLLRAQLQAKRPRLVQMLKSAASRQSFLIGKDRGVACRPRVPSVALVAFPPPMTLFPLKGSQVCVQQGVADG